MVQPIWRGNLPFSTVGVDGVYPQRHPEESFSWPWPPLFNFKRESVEPKGPKFSLARLAQSMPSTPSQVSLARLVDVTTAPGQRTNQDFSGAIIVGDNFKNPQEIDINGDGDSESITHGEIVTHFIEDKTQGKAKVIGLQAFEEGDLSQLGKTLEEIIRHTERGEVPSAVNLSLEVTTDFKIIQQTPGLEGVTPENIIEKRALVLQKLREAAKTQETPARIIKVIEDLEKITASGTKVFVAAGNKGKDSFNFLLLAKGVIGVGATNAQGEAAPFSSIQGSTGITKQGMFNITQVSGGYDYTGDGKADIATQDVSDGSSIPAQFTGKRLDDLLAKSEEVSQLSRILKSKDIESLSPQEKREIQRLINARLFTAKDLRQIYGDKLPEEKLVQAEFRGPYMTLDLGYSFRKDSQGRTVYNPDQSNRTPAVGLLEGTSFSAPIAAAEQWNKTHSQTETVVETPVPSPGKPPVTVKPPHKPEVVEPESEVVDSQERYPGDVQDFIRQCREVYHQLVGSWQQHQGGFIPFSAQWGPRQDLFLPQRFS